MQKKRIIPCLDVNDGRVVKGVNFINLKDAGNPVELAKFYSEEGADEIFFLDMTASFEERKSIVDVIKNIALEVKVPLTVGGGIRNIEDIQNILEVGANKVVLNSIAVRDKKIISEASKKFGKERIVIGIDYSKNEDGNNEVYIAGGRVNTGLDVVEWAREVEKLGAGEILLTSMDRDGTKAGFDLDLLAEASKALDIPIIAAGGCGKLEHFSDVFEKTQVSAALAASLFHFGELKVPEVKKYLDSKNIEVTEGEK